MAKITKEKVNYGISLQTVLLSYMLSDTEAFIQCQNIIQPQYFDSSLQPAVKLILDHSSKYKGLPPVELIKAQTGVEVTSVEVSDASKTWFLDQIELFCRHKAIEAAILSSADLLEQGFHGDLESIMKDAVLISLNRELGTNYFEDPKKRLEKLLNQNGNISTGWKAVDKIVYKLGKGELAIFTAVTGGGKSVALQNLTVNWALQNYNVVYFSLELSEELVAKRLDSMITNIPNVSIFKQIDRVELIVKQKERHLGAIQVKYLKSGSNTNDLRAYLKEYQIQYNKKPDMIVVDYLDLMAPNSKRIDQTNLFAKDKLVAEELRSLGMELEIIVATAAQLNRSGYDELNPTSANIAGGISKANTADLVVNISNTAASRDRGEINFHFMKTRNSGGVGQHIALKFDVDTLRITDPDDFSAASTKAEAQHLIETSQSNDVPIFDNTSYGSHTVYKDEIATNSGSKDMSPALARLLNQTKK
jgi:replicative DNA helicase